MTTTALTPFSLKSTHLGPTTDRPLAMGLLLLAAAAVLVAFGIVVSRLADRADLARAAAAITQQERIGCERHALAIERNDCRQALLGSMQSR